MASQLRAHRPVVSDLPGDFGERIEEFRVASGLGVRSLARLLGVSPYRLREWRRGVAPSSGHLYALFTIADATGLRSILVRPDQDLPPEVSRWLQREAPEVAGDPSNAPSRLASELGTPAAALVCELRRHRSGSRRWCSQATRGKSLLGEVTTRP